MRRRRTKGYALALLLTAAAAVGSARLVKACEPYAQQEIYFSEEDSFSETDVSLELSTLLPSEIHYTLDGSTPTAESALYTEPLVLTAEAETKAYPVQALAVYRDGTESPVCAQTYFVGQDVEARFSTLTVSLTGDPDGLFGYENGILVTGALRDDYVLENPGVEVNDADPANFYLRGEESEREVRAEIWDADGTKLLSQDLGVRVHGGLSRSSDVKSLRLIARKEYGESRIEAPLFSDGQLDKRVLLRSHGNDQEEGYLRNELGERLAADAGFPCTQEFRAASVWINGAYYGFAWLEECYDANYFHTLYGTKEEDGTWLTAAPYQQEGVSSFTGTDAASGGQSSGTSGSAAARIEASEESTYTEEDRQAEQDLAEVMAYAEQDLTDDAVYAELEARLDVDNFLQYCAIEIYLANVDWPYNNCKAYRWYAEDSAYDSEAGTDGRWRFQLYDLDISMSRIPDAEAGTRSLAIVLGSEEVESAWKQDTPLLKALLQRNELRERFRELLETYIEGAFAPEHVEEVLADIEEEMAGELSYQMLAYAREQAEDNGTDVETEYTLNQAIHAESVAAIRTFFAERPAVIQEELEKLDSYLGLAGE